jgi:hypothetical protein
VKNAKEEFVEHVGEKQILYALIEPFKETYGKLVQKRILHIGYNDNDYQIFLNSLDFMYDDGYGGQNLFGTIWYTDDTWSERSEYDGMEWWEHKERPRIPYECT